MGDLRFAVLGTGFWSHFQIPAWFEVGGVKLTALYNRTVSKAERVAHELDLRDVHIYSDPEELIENEELEFIDIITEVEAHAPLVYLAARSKIPVICQKPMAPDLATAQNMVRTCREAGVPFFIHENFRWQTPIRALKDSLVDGLIGRPFRAHISFVTAFPAFANQPSLKSLQRLIIADLGSHMLDITRFLFGEASGLYCLANKVHPDIRGEDAATILLEVGDRTAVVINMAYAESPLERDPFPQTLVFVEGERGSLELAPNYWLRLTTKEGTFARRVPPPHYKWADSSYDVVHASIVPCNANLLRALKGEGEAETTGDDNLKTARLVFASYESLAKGVSVRLSD